jgi:hypothetical protein
MICALLLARPAKRYPAAIGFDLLDLYVDDIADMKVGSARQLGAVEQAVLFDADVYEGAKVDDVADGALQPQPRFEVVER